MEDDVEVSGGGRHQEEEEVEVGVGEKTVLVDRVEQVAPVHRQLVHVDDEVGVELGVGDLLVRRLAKHHLFRQAATGCHCIVEVPCAHQSCLPA